MSNIKSPLHDSVDPAVPKAKSDLKPYAEYKPPPYHQRLSYLWSLINMPF